MKTSEIISRLQNRRPTILGRENFREFGILIPMIEIEDETHLLFEVRSKHMRSQPGDICFPGGRVDESDKSELHCALRETSEELGVNQENIRNIIPLDYIVSDFGRIIFPFTGTLHNPEKIVPNPAEVEEVFKVPLRFFLETKPKVYQVNFKVIPEQDFPYEDIQGGRAYDWNAREMSELFYYYQDKVIWGLTAKIIAHFVALLQEKKKN
ncbi:NUDIX hydrolase [Virgibacillus pantothenticus]|uniref:NUDIX hydrolase n=1 Tax=Virgibacillus pantothenticus TaxID=1473 RepID=UPI000984265D|nr:CoA pyrophosphatase [Virgibacillus pantothenticus]